MKFKALFKKLKGNEKGVTLLISVLILALLTILVSAALINTTSSAISTNNDAATKQAFYAAFGGLEKMSKEFSDIFTANTSLTQAQLDLIASQPPTMPGITITQDIRFSRTVGSLPLQTGPYSGLNTLRNEYLFVSRAVTNNGVTVELSRSLYNNLIPIFQFGIFSTRHIEFYNGPPFGFGGRVHANGDIYLNNSGELDFADRVTTTRDFVRQKMRNNSVRGQGSVVIKNPITSSSVTLTPNDLGSVINGPNLTARPEPGHPVGTDNRTAFSNFITTMVPGRLFFEAPPLKLPIQNGGNRPIELIRRGLPDETTVNNILAQSRFYNKAGLRITLSDTQLELPGKTGGIQLDVPITTGTNADQRLGYVPKQLKSNYQASRVNGHRIKGWIKVETVKRNPDGTLTETDVTEAILALGVTKVEGNDVTNLNSAYSETNLDDSKSIIRLQRYSLPGTPIYRSNGTSGDGLSNTGADAGLNRLRPSVYTPATTSPVAAAKGVGLVDTDLSGVTMRDRQDTPAVLRNNPYSSSTNNYMLAYPITLFDQREGMVLDYYSTALPASTNLETRGLFTLVDIDMANLTQLLTGYFDADFAGSFPSFNASKINSETNGWIIYVSDRRGDKYTAGLSSTDPDLYNLYKGKFDCETVYGYGSGGTNQNYVPASGNTLFGIEDINDNNIIEGPGINGNEEAGPPNEALDIVDAATKGPWKPNSSGNTRVDLSVDPNTLTARFRRAVRLVRGRNLQLPFKTGSSVTKPLDTTRGLTMSAENPIYVQGDYNTTIFTPPNGTQFPTPASFYGTTAQVPAALICDAVTLLSNNWVDTENFVKAHSKIVTHERDVLPTAYRFAVFTGRTRDGLYGTAGPGGATDTVMWGTRGSTNSYNANTTTAIEKDDVRLYGGVHNFLRYIEDWNNVPIRYLGSLIDGWDSWQANGTFKCCDYVYGAPTRDYTFDTTFLNANQLPPGTPNLQYILFTSFRENVRAVQP